MSSPHRFTATAEDAGLRLDQVIAARAQGVSRTLAKKVLTAGGVFVDRKRVKVAGRLVREGQKIEVHVGTPATRHSEVSAIEVPIVAMTDQYIVVDKPSGVFSAPTPETDRNDLLAFLAHHLKAQDEPTELHLVHRLDRPTSGLMVVARTKSAASSLGAQAAKHSMNRQYLALLAGTLTGETACDQPISDKQARTFFAPMETRDGVTHTLATLQTGRTHQVRLHAEALGAPVAGDSKYGRFLQRGLPTRPPRMALHATELTFTEPNSNKVATFQSPLPSDLRGWWDGLAHS